ncbi:MAG: SAM-dependent methyltransferase [Candidatus Levybacteria bacterium RIFCSPLOWO2_01_FULL_38_21]|nr:MAG: SAM-dependent methyltransferase [Candidatus Levybacteria bacterium RIFCSPLOWO2_01_FULL_38_21]
MNRYNKNNGTKTSAFGSPGRVNHDSSKFYNSKLYSGNGQKNIPEFVENSILRENINRVFCKSSEKMSELSDNSVHLMVTSPPYNVGKEYDNDLTLEEYRKLLYNVFKETYRVLVPGGRACINVANLGRKPYLPLHSYVIEEMDKLGFLMRGEIIWNKASSASQSFAWGSWLSASNPTLRDIHEYILVFSKGRYDRKKSDKKSTISKEEFMEFTKSIWTFSAERASRVKHPAPFPVELAYRLIQLYTFENDVVLDPFLGSGTTCIAALKTNRKYIGYDIDKKYCEIAEKRIEEFKMGLSSLFSQSILTQ